jgi:hypothetical protein
MNADERKLTTNVGTTSTRITLTSDATTTTRVTLETKDNDEATIETIPHTEHNQDPWCSEPFSQAITTDNETCPESSATTATSTDTSHVIARNLDEPGTQIKVSIP